MMKGFVSVFKMLGLATLAIGLMVSGCMDTDSSMEKQAANLVDHGAFTIPVTVDPANQSLTFGDGSNSGVGTFDGHVVEVQNVACSGSGTPGDQTSCTIRVINRDPSNYMVNTFVMLSFCVDCVGGQNWGNADCAGSPCIRACGVDSTGSNGCGTNAPVGSQAGFCVVEDGNYAAGQPYTAKGCANSPTVAADYKPHQVISPVCGFEDVQWDFATTDGTHFTFYANVTAQWHPMDPTADSRNNANDWYNRTVMMFMLVDLDEPGTDVGSAWGGPNWNVGAYQHSTVIGGYGAASHVTMPAGKYFAINMAVDYPDRIEAQNPGYYTNFTDYEYGALYAAIIRFNPAVVAPVTVDGPTDNTWMTFVFSGGQPNCLMCDHQGSLTTQRRMFDSVTGLEVHGTTNSTIAFADKGFVYSFPLIDTNPFSWNANAPTGNPWRYYTAGGAFVCVRAANILPIRAGHYGNTRIGALNCGGTTPLHTNELTVMVNEGPDPQPDIPLGLYYFKVEPVGGGVSPSGLGTMFYPESHSGYYGYVYAYTAHTRDGGSSAGSDDWTQYCAPFDGGFDNAVNQGCPAGKISAIPDVDWVFKGQEQSNPKISQTGFATPGAGSFIGWTASMCVQ